jgi:hypothetical protein
VYRITAGSAVFDQSQFSLTEYTGLVKFSAVSGLAKSYTLSGFFQNIIYENNVTQLLKLWPS